MTHTNILDEKLQQKIHTVLWDGYFKDEFCFLIANKCEQND